MYCPEFFLVNFEYIGSAPHRSADCDVELEVHGVVERPTPWQIDHVYNAAFDLIPSWQQGVHEITGVFESRLIQDTHGILAQLPDWRAVADRLFSSDRFQGSATAPHDVILLRLAERWRRLVQMTMEADLVALFDNRRDHLGILFRNPAWGEKRGLQAEPLHQLKNAGRADVDLELACGAGHRLIKASHDPRGIRVHIVSKQQARALAIWPYPPPAAHRLTQTFLETRALDVPHARPHLRFANRPSLGQTAR